MQELGETEGHILVHISTDPGLVIKPVKAVARRQCLGPGRVAADPEEFIAGGGIIVGALVEIESIAEGIVPEPGRVAPPVLSPAEAEMHLGMECP